MRADSSLVDSAVRTLREAGNGTSTGGAGGARRSTGGASGRLELIAGVTGSTFSAMVRRSPVGLAGRVGGGGTGDVVGAALFAVASPRPSVRVGGVGLRGGAVAADGAGMTVLRATVEDDDEDPKAVGAVESSLVDLGRGVGVATGFNAAAGSDVETGSEGVETGSEIVGAGSSDRPEVAVSCFVAISSFKEAGGLPLVATLSEDDPAPAVSSSCAGRVKYNCASPKPKSEKRTSSAAIAPRT